MTKLFFAALLSSVTVPAHAEPATIASSTVETADLDLTTASGRRLLDLRLLHAVKQVCGEASDADLAGNNEIRRCRVETLALVAGERDERIARASSDPIRVAAR